MNKQAESLRCYTVAYRSFLSVYGIIVNQKRKWWRSVDQIVGADNWHHMGRVADSHGETTANLGPFKWIISARCRARLCVAQRVIVWNTRLDCKSVGSVVNWSICCWTCPNKCAIPFIHISHNDTPCLIEAVLTAKIIQLWKTAIYYCLLALRIQTRVLGDTLMQWALISRHISRQPI